MSHFEEIETWSLKQVHQKMEEKYGLHENRKLIIAAAPNQYDTCNVFYLSLNGSPPRAHCLYWLGTLEVHLMKGSLSLKDRYPRRVKVPELEALRYHPGLYVYDPETDSLTEYKEVR